MVAALNTATCLLVAAQVQLQQDLHITATAAVICCTKSRQQVHCQEQAGSPNPVWKLAIKSTLAKCLWKTGGS
jgi:hypothetical protein